MPTPFGSLHPARLAFRVRREHAAGAGWIWSRSLARREPARTAFLAPWPRSGGVRLQASGIGLERCRPV